MPVTILAPDQAQPYGIAVNASTVFWTNFGNNTVASCPRGPAPVISFFKTLPTQTRPNGMVATNDGVYWTTLSGEIMYAMRSVVQPRVLASVPHAAQITLYQGTLFFVTYTNNRRAIDTVYRMPIAGGTPVAIAGDQGGPAGIVADGDAVYWTNYKTGQIMALPAGGGSPSVIASGQGGPTGIAIDAQTVYWTNYDTGQVMACARVSSAPPRVLADGLDLPYRLVLDRSTLYWTTNSKAGAVMKLAPGARPVTLAGEQPYASGLAVDGEYVYWVNFANPGSVQYIAKKLVTRQAS